MFPLFNWFLWVLELLYFLMVLLLDLEINLILNNLFCLRLLLIAAWLIFNINALVVLVFDMWLRSFVLVELLLQLLLVHHGSARPVAVGHLILAFVCVVSEFEAPLAADHSWSLLVMQIFFHKYYAISKLPFLCRVKKLKLSKSLWKSDKKTLKIENESYFVKSLFNNSSIFAK